MADLLQTGLTFLAAKLKANASRSVTYKRVSGGVVTASITLSATVGTSQVSNLNVLGMTPQLTDAANPAADDFYRDYIVTVADLVDSGSEFLPASGDLIDDTNDATGVTHRYEVKALTGQNHWRYSGGSHNVMMRIHTKHYGTV